MGFHELGGAEDMELCLATLDHLMTNTTTVVSLRVGGFR